ncbi:FTR1 family protein [Klebsiella oxytoca]|nr:FTR1 family protein [Klebsiella oxytoca]
MTGPRSFLLLMLLSLLFGSACAMAQTQYAPYIEDIEQRLDKTAELYQQQKNTDARREVQMAYFEVFENLEGPIRINISARKSYEMESTFGEIRRMIGEGKPIGEVQARIDGLKQALREVEPVLDGGHRLVAEEQHTALTRDDIAQHWQESFRTLDDRLAQAVTEYQAGNYAQASQQVQQAQYQGFKNSGMETSVRQNRSAKEAAAINQQFSALLTLTAQPDRLNEVSYQVTTLLQDLEDILPGLPTTRDDRPMGAPSGADNAALADETTARADWASVAQGINQSINAALTRYQNGEGQEAILDVQDTYFDRFEATGMENKIGSRDAAFKTSLEAHFTRMVSLMKAGQPQERLAAEAAALEADLQKAVTMLGEGEETQWSLLLYSLMIIVREGLEALLIVAAIVAYLVKNNHHDKLPLIRQSVMVALVASVATAFIFQLLFTQSGASRELLEGITMLIAVVMLFLMSYWLLSKVEARHWKAWLEGKLSPFAVARFAGGTVVNQLPCGLPRGGRNGAVLLRPDWRCPGAAGPSCHRRRVCYRLCRSADRLARHALLGGPATAQTLLPVHRRFYVPDGVCLRWKRGTGTGGGQTISANADRRNTGNQLAGNLSLCGNAIAAGHIAARGAGGAMDHAPSSGTR